jgi:hypothetical protein
VDGGRRPERAKGSTHGSMPSADGLREDDSEQPFDRMATANVLVG